jgi:hypothetical protein
VATHVNNSEASMKISWSLVTLVCNEIDAELVRAVGKHGLGRTPMNPNMEPSTAFIILAEEFGEVAETLTYDKRDDDKYEQELIQVAAMAVAAIVGSRLRKGAR